MREGNLFQSAEIGNYGYITAISNSPFALRRRLSWDPFIAAQTDDDIPKKYRYLIKI